MPHAFFTEEDPHRFAARVHDFLVADPVGNTLPLTVLDAVTRGHHPDFVLGAVDAEGGAVLACAVQTPPRNVIVGGVMRAVFGDATTFEATTEDLFYTGLPRTYATFSAAAEENALSRIYLGVHYRWDADFGMAARYEVAERVMATLLL